MEIKVPFFNIVNIFLPGMMLIGSCVLLFLDEVKALVARVAGIGSAGLEVVITVSLFAIAYEAGYIIFRLGSLLIEPILKKLFGWAEYGDFIKAGKTGGKAYDKLEMYSREYGFARTQIMLFIILTALTAIQAQWWLAAIGVVSIGLFVLTARGHMKRLRQAVSLYLAPSNAESGESSNG